MSRLQRQGEVVQQPGDHGPSDQEQREVDESRTDKCAHQTSCLIANDHRQEVQSLLGGFDRRVSPGPAQRQQGATRRLEAVPRQRKQTGK